MTKWRTISGFVKVGQLGKTHGAAGELKIHAEEEVLEKLLGENFLFVDIAGNKVPLEVDTWRLARGPVVGFCDITDTTQAAELTGRPVYLPEGTIEIDPVPPTDLQHADLNGFRIHDKALGDLGRIDEVLAYPQQEMARVGSPGNHVLIPLNDVFILRVDQAARVVHVDLPGGLLDQ